MIVGGGEIAGHGRCWGHLEQELEASGREERHMMDIESLGCDFSRMAGSLVWQKNPKRVEMIVGVPLYIPGRALLDTTGEGRMSGNSMDPHKFGTSLHEIMVGEVMKTCVNFVKFTISLAH
jgi:hypothetical protein